MTLQSYNHVLPQSIIKKGWGFQIPKIKERSVLVLNIDRLYSYIKEKDILLESELKKFLSFRFGEEESKGGVITRRSPSTIFGNKLVENLTENKFGLMEQNIERDIESKIFNAIKNNTIHELDLPNLYEWFSLQNARSIPILNKLIKEYKQPIKTKEDYFYFIK